MYFIQVLDGGCWVKVGRDIKKVESHWSRATES